MAQPAYLHLPAAVNASGEKLSKQTRAKPIDDFRPQAALSAVLSFLGQQPPGVLVEADLDSLWRWAIMHWNRSALPGRRAAVAPVEYF